MMKKIMISCGLSVVLCFATVVHAEEENVSCADPALALEFLESSRFPDVLDSTIADQLKSSPLKQSESATKQQREFMEKTIGWAALKQPLIDIACNVYSPKELQAAIDFNKTPMGDVLAHKGIEFSKQFSTVVSEAMTKHLSELFKGFGDFMKKSDEPTAE